MVASAFYGYKCPKCNSKITVGVLVGAKELHCPNCNIVMVPDQDGQASASNVYCPNCKNTYGIVSSDRCPICGGPFSKIP